MSRLFASLTNDAFFIRPSESSIYWLEVTRGGDHVFLVDGGRREQGTIEPDHRLLVVGVGPEGMEHIIGAY